MLEMIRDPAWQFVGALLALVALGVSLWAYLSQRSKKRLLVERVARIPLVTSGARGIRGLEVRLNGKALNNATILLIRVQNIGNRPILTNDFEEPLSIQCGEDALVLSADVGDSTPTDLGPRVTFSDNTVTIERQLLNPGDAFTCRILAENSRGKFSARARIAGVRRLEDRRGTSLLQPLVGLACLVIAIGALYFSPSPKSNGLADLRAGEVPYLVVAMLAMIVLLVVLFRDLVSRTRTLLGRVRLLGADGS